MRPATPDDDKAVAAFLAERGADVVARLGVLEDATRAPKLLVKAPGALVGVLSYLIDGDACEVLTLHTAVSGHGVGTALLEGVEAIATAKAL